MLVDSSFHIQTVLIDFENNYYSSSSLYAVIIQVVIMLIDRCCYVKVCSMNQNTFPYLQGLLFGKIVLQYIFNASIFALILLILPAYTNTPFGDNINVLIFLFIQIGYMVASAGQIRYGYPTSDTYIASMIDNSYSILNRCIFFVCLPSSSYPIIIFVIVISSCIVIFHSSSRFIKYLIGLSRQHRSISCTGLRFTVPTPFSMIANVEYDDDDDDDI